MTPPTAVSQEESAPSLAPFRAGLWFGFFNAPTWQIALGAPLILLAEHIGATVFQVGLLHAFVFLLVPMQVVATVALPVFGFKKLMLFGWGIRTLFLSIPLVLALASLRFAGEWMVLSLLIAIFGFCFFRSIGSCAFIPWIYSIVPARSRGRYFATDQLLSGMAGVATLLVCSALFFFFDSAWAFVSQFGIATASSLLAWVALSKLPDGALPATLKFSSLVREVPAVCLRRSAFRFFLLLSVGMTLFTIPIAPFAAYYLKAEMGVAAERIILFTTFQYVGLIAAAAFAKAKIDRLGPVFFLRLGIVAFLGVGIFWLLLLSTLPQLAPILGLAYLWLGAGSACWMSGSLNYLPKVLTDEAKRPLHLSVYSALTAFLGGLSPLVWGLWLTTAEPGETGISVDGFIAFFVFVLVLATAVLVALTRISAPTLTSPPLLAGLGSLRPVRFFQYLFNPVVHRTNPRRPNDRDNKEP